MDLTYYVRILRVENRADFKSAKYYGRIWFGFNEKIIWKQTRDVEIER